jgi:hypothetical protein
MSRFYSIKAIADQAKIDADEAKTEAFMAEFEAVLASEFADMIKSDAAKCYAEMSANRARVLEWLADVAFAHSEDAESKATASSVWLADTAVVM